MFEVKKLTIRVNTVLNQGHGRSNGGGKKKQNKCEKYFGVGVSKICKRASLRGKSNTVKFHSWVAREY